MTTPPGKLDLKIYQGAALNEVLTVESEDEDGNSTVTDLTGYTARAQAREDYDSADAFMDLTTENDGITIDGENGKITLYMPATDTAAVTVEGGFWDLELIPPSGEDDTIRLLQGKICISKEATR